MKAHIREEKKTEPLKLGKGTLFQNKDGEIYKVCDTAEYDETYTDDEIRNPIWDKYEIVGISFDTSNNPNKKFFKPVYIMSDGDVVACDGTHDFDYDPNKEVQIIPKESIPFYGKPTEPAVYCDNNGNCVDVDGNPLGMKWDDFMEKQFRTVNK